MKINELINESFVNIEDPDTEKVPNLVMQIRKSIDLGGDSPIVFQDGSKVRLSANAMYRFLTKYESFKPIDREEMQKVAIQSKNSFDNVLDNFNKPKAPKSIY